MTIFKGEDVAEDIKKGFKEPGKEFRGAPFWSWNDDLEDKELARQIKEMDENGWGGFFMHSRIGLITPYLTKEWMKRIRTCVSEAKKRGMGAWLYDEDRWPSGFAGGIVTAKDENKMKGLECTIEGENIVSTRVITGPPNPWYNNQTYLDTMNPEAVDDFIEVTHEAYYREFGSEFGKSIPGIFTDEPNYFTFQGGAFSPSDPSKKVCVIPWTGGFQEYFRKRKGYDIMEKLPLLFFPGEGCEKARYDYWEAATDLFLESYSKKMYDWCEERNLRYAGHYLCEDTLESQILCIGAAMPHYEYMHVPGIDHLCRNISNVMTPKQCSSAAHQLGRLRTLSETYGCSGQNFSFTGRKWIGDWEFVLGINILNHHLSLYSMKGCRKRDFPPNIYFQQPWWKYNRVIEDYFTRLTYMLTRGKHKCDILLMHPMGSAWVAYSRLDAAKCNEMSSAFERLSIDLCSLQRDYDYGDEKLMEKYARLSWVEQPAKGMDGNKGYYDGAFMKRLPRLQVGGSRYELVIIPSSITLRKNTFKLLKEFKNSGGKVIALEPAPTMVDCQASDELKEFISSIKVIPANKDNLKVLLDEMLDPEVTVADKKKTGVPAIYYQHRTTEDADIFFLCNTDQEKEFSTTVTLNSLGKAEEWDLFTGKIAEIPFRVKGNKTQIELDFSPAGSHLIMVERKGIALKHFLSEILPANEKKIKEEKVRLKNEWTFERKDMNALTLDYCRRYRIGDQGWTESKVPVWKVQAEAEKRVNVSRPESVGGQASCQSINVEMELDFNMDYEMPEDARLFFVMEKPEIYGVKVNGKTVKYRDTGYWTDTSFKKIDIRQFVKMGENTVALSCDFRLPIKPGTMIYTKDGVELESCYIVGDFAVEHKDRKEFRLVPERKTLVTGDLVDQGYPFFAGTISLSQTVNIDKEKGRRYNLEFSRLNAIVTAVKINGKPEGLMIFPPFKLDITDALKKGENKITLELAHSLHNLLGPHHKQGELFGVGPHDFTDEANWKDDYFFVKYGVEI